MATVEPKYIHFPSGAIPKDGPSAGITIFAALLSLLTRRPARRDVALAKAVVERDARLDAMHRDIEKKAIRLIALRQPVASDLRKTLSAMKLATDLERGQLTHTDESQFKLGENVAATPGQVVWDVGAGSGSV